MESVRILENTPFKYPCNVYKENTIPILKDYNVSDQCKEIGKQLLNMTKNPLCQHVDVLIPKLERNDYAKSQMEHFKSFFGTKYTNEAEAEQPSNNNSLQQQQQQQQQKSDNKIQSKNAFQFESSITKPIIEFITTEETYVSLLDEVVNKIMKPIKESIANKEQPILDQYSFNRIFINLEDILAVNQNFLSVLKQYESGTSSCSFGQIIANHIETFDCYKIFLLGKPNSLSCHSQNLKQNKNYAKFLLNKTLQKNFGMSDVLISPVQRMGRYDLMIKNILSALDPNDNDTDYLKQAAQKISSINDMRYGSDSSLLNLYHLIREAPASLIQTRKLLGYFDASELSLLTGKTHRPVTLLVFTDKIMIVKRKNYNLQSKDYLENIEEKVKVGSSNTILQKAKEVYNGLPFEFKGWVDIQSVELFHGLKDRPDTFFLRTCLPELNPMATEKEVENYFRRSDRLYSIIPNTSTRSVSKSVEKKSELIQLCQKQLAVQCKDNNNVELYYEDKFKLPAYTRIYDEDSYKLQEYKNNILIIYVEDNLRYQIDINALLTDQVWIVILLTHHEGGYKPTIRARTNLIPIREISRELEYESIVMNTNAKKDPHAPLDFIDTLWNNLFFYERRLRATECYSNQNDDLLRERARSRSRSKSLTRVASNMSIGKLFARSRSTSPSRRSSTTSSTERTDDDDEDDESCAQTPPPDPFFKVATVNKHTGNEFRAPTTQYSPPPPLATSVSDYYATATAAYQNKTQPQQYRYNKDHLPPNEIFVRDDHSFIDSFHDGVAQQQQPPQDFLYGTAAAYQQDNSYRPSTRQHGGSISSFDALLFSNTSSPSSPDLLSRPSSSSNNSGSSASSETAADRYLLLTRGGSDSLGSKTSSSIRSYFDEFVPHSPSTSSSSYRGNYRNQQSFDEKLMSTIDGSVTRRSSSSRRSRAPLNPNFYTHGNQTQPQPQPPTLQHRAHTMPDMVSTNFSQLKDDVNGLIDELIQSQQQLRSQQDMGRYYNSTYESVQGLRTHIVSKIDNLMENLHHSQQYQLR